MSKQEKISYKNELWTQIKGKFGIKGDKGKLVQLESLKVSSIFTAEMAYDANKLIDWYLKPNKWIYWHTFRGLPNR